MSQGQSYFETDFKEPLLLKTVDLKEVNVFKIAAQDLASLFVHENTYRYEKRYLPKMRISKSLHKLKELGGLTFIMKALLSDRHYGIVADEKDIKRRTYFFGNNERQLPEIQPYMLRLKDCATAGWMKILFYTATIAMIAGWLSRFDGTLSVTEWQYFMEGISIYFSLIFMTVVTATTLHFKDKSFQKIVKLFRRERVAVLRGREGYTETIDSGQLVVGDIILLDEGMKVPADCILIENSQIATDESIFTGNKKLVEKNIFIDNGQFQNFIMNPNPFLFSQSLIISGQGKALVCSVGDSAFIGTKREILNFEKELTPTQQRLQNISEHISKIGNLVSLIVLGALILHLILSIFIFDRERKEFISMETLQAIINHISCAVALVIVAIPEGLPMAITLGLAFQFSNNTSIVKNLAASEKFGGAQEILFSKTGILTQNKDLKVQTFFAEGRIIEIDAQKNKLIEQDFISSTELIIESILFNATDARIEMNPETAQFKPEGNQIDCALLEFLQDNEVELQKEWKFKLQGDQIVKCQIPFHSHRMMSTTVIQHPKKRNLVRVFCKGAPEILLQICTKRIHTDGKKIAMNEAQKHTILNEIVIEKIAKRGLKPIAMGYKDLTIEQYSTLAEKCNDFYDSKDITKVFENNLTLVSIFGVEDPIREGVKEQIALCRQAGVTLRMISNDNLFTATAIALKVGLIDKQMALEQYVCVDGQFFKQYVGGMRKIYDEYTGTDSEQVAKKFHFKQITTKLRILGRCTPEVKSMLVSGLMEESIVAVTGSSITDVKALQKADVGICLGSRMQSEVCKENSDIILIEESFNSIVTALIWGRVIYQNVRKFLQLQLTMNIVILMIVLVGSVTFGDSPITPVQLLWCNIIMDILGVLALSTEPPTMAVLTNQRPQKRDEKVISSAITRNIVLSAIYQIIILLIVIFSGQGFLDLPYTRSTEFYDPITFEPTNKAYHFTIIFHCLGLQTIFQMINSRKTGESEYNIFEDFFKNPLFVGIIIIVTSLQVVFIELGGGLFRCAPLTIKQHATCFIIGSSVLIVIFLIKLIPSRLFLFIQISEDAPVNSNDYVVDDYKPIEISEEEQLRIQDQLREENDRVNLELEEEERNNIVRRQHVIQYNQEDRFITSPAPQMQTNNTLKRTNTRYKDPSPDLVDSESPDNNESPLQNRPQQHLQYQQQQQLNPGSGVEPAKLTEFFAQSKIFFDEDEEDISSNEQLNQAQQQNDEVVDDDYEDNDDNEGLPTPIANEEQELNEMEEQITPEIIQQEENDSTQQVPVEKELQEWERNLNQLDE